MNLDELAPYLASCPYPPQLVSVDRGIRGRGYYPAAEGFHNGGNPASGIMFLGRDWGTRLQYDRWKGVPPQNETAITWTRTRDIYLPALQGIPVWCTNYLLGVRVEGSAVGNIRDRVDANAWTPYEEYCWRFLQRQVLLQQPKLIVIFGKHNRYDLENRARLGTHPTECFQHTFESDSASFTSKVTYADHPHSLTSPVVMKRASAQLARFPTLYQSSVAKIA